MDQHTSIADAVVDLLLVLGPYLLMILGILTMKPVEDVKWKAASTAQRFCILVSSGLFYAGALAAIVFIVAAGIGMWSMSHVRA
jgi:hypothetical protein